jgi:hypothetical protein
MRRTLRWKGWRSCRIDRGERGGNMMEIERICYPKQIIEFPFVLH